MSIDNEYNKARIMLPACTFLQNLRSPGLLSTFADFTITSDDGVEYRVHSLIISAHSKYFHRLCQGTFEEAKTHTVTLHDDPPEAVKLMVDFFNTFDYDTSFNLDEVSILEMHAMVFTIADKYEINDLKAHALRKFATKTEEHVVQAVYSTRLVAYVYNQAPPSKSLRILVVDIWRRRRRGSAVLDLGKEEWKGLLEAYPEFGADLVHALMADTW